jgi:hypothetical protein
VHGVDNQDKRKAKEGECVRKRCLSPFSLPGRTAYLAGFHAAQGFIFERMGKAFKTQKGVQIEFLRLTKDDPRFSSDLRSFLSQAYNLKA